MVKLGTCDKALAAVGAGQLGLGVVVLQVVVQAVLRRVGQRYFSSKQTSQLRAQIW